MTLTRARKRGQGHPGAAIVAAHNALIQKYVQDGRHLAKGRIKTFGEIGHDLGHLLRRQTVRTVMRLEKADSGSLSL